MEIWRAFAFLYSLMVDLVEEFNDEVLLSSYRLEVDPFCYICGSAIESDLHVLRDCVAASTFRNLRQRSFFKEIDVVRCLDWKLLQDWCSSISHVDPYLSSHLLLTLEM